MDACCPIVELRQYTLQPGQRDVLIELFDRELVETQEATGMQIIGQFRDLDRPDVFVWLRGFPDMERRHEALVGFYGGPVWKAHAPAARATMVDTDNALLLRPLTPESGFTLPPRPAPGEDVPGAPVFVTIYPGATPAPVDPEAVAVLVTEPSENTFPALPVREGEYLVVVHRGTAPDVAGEPVQRLRLEPTARSALR